MGNSQSTSDQPSSGVLGSVSNAAYGAVDAVKSGVSNVTESVKNAVGVPSASAQANALGTPVEGTNPMLGGRRRHRKGKKTTMKGGRRRRTTRKH